MPNENQHKNQHNTQRDGNRRDEQWDACPGGELMQMVHRLDASQRRARGMQVAKTALLSTAVFACVVLALGSFMGSGDLQLGGIHCDYCQGRLAEYYPHAAGELVHEDATFVTSMETHLENCEFCRGKFNAMYPELNTTGTPGNTATLRPLLALGQFAIPSASVERFW